LVEQYDAAHPRPARPAEFAAAAGAQLVGRGLTQRLVVDAEVLARTAAQAMPPRGYTLLRWGTVLPEAWVGQASALEISSGDCAWDEAAATQAEGSYIRQFEVMREGRGRRAFQAGLVAPDGRLAGFRSISMSASTPSEALEGI